LTTSPTREECLALIRRMEMLPNIVDHSMKVALVAVFLADSLKLGGVILDRNLIEAAALLHDITKTRSLATGENHAATGAELVASMGYSRIAEVIAQHVVIVEDLTPERPNEVDVVNYADKRVLHDRVASIEDRRDYVMARYGRDPKIRGRITRNWQRVAATEQKLFRFLSFTPGDLDTRLTQG
jgi:uncharacterized protein